MGKRPAGCTIERKNVNGDYTPDNCIWASVDIQARNRRNNVRLQLDGKDMIAVDWAAEKGIPVNVIYHRKRLGWSDADVLNIPIGTFVGRPAELIHFNGRALSLPDWSRTLGIPASCLDKRLNMYGWSVERALTTTVDTSKHTSKRKAKEVITCAI
jgi:hypothetical protein